MSLSINTNRGATVALQSLNRTNRELDSVQKRVSTGFRVSDAKDDGAAFAIAQGLRAKVKAYDALNERFASAVGKLEIHAAAINAMSETTATMGGILVKLADESLSADERATYGKDYLALRSEIQRLDNQSGNATGFNLLGQAGSYNYFIESIQGDRKIIPGMFIANTVYINANLPTAAPDAATSKTMLATNGGFREHEKLVGNAIANIGMYLRSYENDIHFTNIMRDTVQNAIGTIVDADLAKDSARMQALQIRQQLGTQTLSIANQAPSAILQLFQ